MDLYGEFTRVIGALNADGIRYAVAGGLAVSLYTTPRATVDIDLLIAAEDVDRVILAVSPIGFRVAGRPMDVARGRLRIQRLIKIEGSDLVPLDLLIPVDAELAGLVDDRTIADWRGTPAAVVSKSALRVLKRLRGSGQDQVDLEALGPES